MTAPFHITLPPPGPCDETNPDRQVVMGPHTFVVIVELLDLERHWMSQANCKGMNPDLFFPDRGDAWTVAAAKQCCDACNVEVQCLEYALAHRERYGIYGGKSERQRRQILLNRRKRVA